MNSDEIVIYLCKIHNTRTRLNPCQITSSLVSIPQTKNLHILQIIFFLKNHSFSPIWYPFHKLNKKPHYQLGEFAKMNKKHTKVVLDFMLSFPKHVNDRLVDVYHKFESL